MTTTPPVLSLDAFRDVVGSIAGVDAAKVEGTSSLWDDLGFDSIRMVELMVAVADLGVTTPEDLGDGVVTVIDAFEAMTASRPSRPAMVVSGPLETRRLRLRPVVADDHLFLYELATSPHLGWRLKSRGLPLTYEDFIGQLHRNVAAQMMLDDVRDGQRVGIVQAIDLNLIDGNARVAITARPERIGSGWAVEGAGLFAAYLFSTFPLRKLYFEVPAFAWPAVASGVDRAFAHEGTLKHHRYAAGQWWDVHVVAIHRDAWAGWGEPQLDVLRTRHQRAGEET